MITYSETPATFDTPIAGSERTAEAGGATGGAAGNDPYGGFAAGGAAGNDPYGGFAKMHGEGEFFKIDPETGALIKTPHPPLSFKGRKQRMNMTPLIFCFFVPWVIFSATFCALSTDLLAKAPGTAWLIVVICAVLTLVEGGFAHRTKMRQDPAQRSPNWHLILCVSMTVAFILGLILGGVNFASTYAATQSIDKLNVYDKLDVAHTTGGMVMDAGKVTFDKDNVVNIPQAMQFKDDKTYCVAPIQTFITASQPHPNHNLNNDFWAVGVDCCTPQFHCGGFNKRELFGTRSVDEHAHKFFRLAVQKAEAKFGTIARHPLFFDLREDSVSFNATKSRHLLMGFLFFAFFQAVVVLFSAVYLTRMSK